MRRPSELEIILQMAKRVFELHEEIRAIGPELTDSITDMMLEYGPSREYSVTAQEEHTIKTALDIMERLFGCGPTIN